MFETAVLNRVYINAYAIAAVVRSKFNDMKVKGGWNKVDPRVALIMALTTMQGAGALSIWCHGPCH